MNLMRLEFAKMQHGLRTPFVFFRKDTSCSFSFIDYILHSWICDYYVIIITYIILYPAFFSFASSKAQFQDFGVA